MNPSNRTIDALDFFEYRFQRDLITYGAPFIIVIGVIGNTLTAVILARPNMRHVSTYVYLFLMALADSVVLLTGLLDDWASVIGLFSVKSHYPWFCRARILLNLTASDYSVWLINAVTVERYVVVCHPLRAAMLCTRTRACVIGAVKLYKVYIGSMLLLVLFGVNLHVLWTLDVSPVEDTNQTRCVLLDEHGRAWALADTLVYSFIPFVVIVVFNALIIHRVLKSKEQRRLLVARAPASNGSNSNPAHAQLRRMTSSSENFRTTSSVKEKRGRVFDPNFRLVAMLLAISITFVVFTLPITILLICRTYLYSSSSIEFLISMTIVEQVFTLLMYLNHASNFFLYCAIGKKFSRELKAALCLCAEGAIETRTMSVEGPGRMRVEQGGMSPRVPLRGKGSKGGASRRSNVHESVRETVI